MRFFRTRAHAVARRHASIMMTDTVLPRLGTFTVRLFFCGERSCVVTSGWEPEWTRTSFRTSSV